MKSTKEEIIVASNRLLNCFQKVNKWPRLSVFLTDSDANLGVESWTFASVDDTTRDAILHLAKIIGYNKKKPTKKLKAIANKVIDIVSEQLGIADLSKITLESELVEDLGVDSLDFVELVMYVEEKFDIEIHDEESDRIKTVNDAIMLVERKLENKKYKGEKNE